MTNPGLRFRSADGTLFEDWKSVKVGDIAETCGGGTPATGNLSYWDGSIQWLTPTEINTKYVHASKRTITLQGLKNSSAKLLPKGAIVLTTRATLGACSINNFEEDVCTNQGFQSLIGKSSVDSEFLYYTVTSQHFQRELKKKASGSTFLEVSPGNLKKIVVAIPGKQEQCRVADFFSTLDEKIALVERKLNALQTLKSGLMQKIFSREIRFKREDGSAYPEWQKGTLSQIVDGLQYGMNSAAIPFDGKHKYLRITDIDEATNRFCEGNVVSPQKEVEDKYRLREGDILFARTGNSVGKTYLYNKEDGEVYFAGFLIRGHVVNSCNPYFIFLQTLSQRYKKWVSTTSMRSGQPGINAEEYGSFGVDLPCLEEQTHIATFFEGIDEKIFCSRKKLKQLKQQKQAFMQQMFV